MEHSDKIINEFKSLFTEDIISIKELKGGVSDKLIIRITTSSKRVIGVYNKNTSENKAFISFTSVFNKLKLNTSEVFHVSDDTNIYFMKDLGYITLYDFILQNPDRFSLIKLYLKVIDNLVKFQILGAKNINFDHCCETKIFDKVQIRTDIDKFKLFFIEKYLQKDSSIVDDSIIEEIMDLTINVSKNYFMYRDFQPRNIIIDNNEPYFVDYQSGRLGPPQYDLISFLYSGSIDLTNDEKKQLTNHYFNEFNKYERLNEDLFYNSLDYFALLRLVQVLGSYCFSYFEKNNKNVIRKVSIAMNNLQTLKLNANLENFKRRITELYATHSARHQ